MSSWVDVSVIDSVLSGLLLAVAALWAWAAFNRMQRDWLEEAADDALDGAEDLGLDLQPEGYRARLVVAGQAQGRRVRVEWRTGALGPCTVVQVDQQRQALPLVRTRDQLMAALQQDAVVG